MAFCIVCGWRPQAPEAELREVHVRMPAGQLVDVPLHPKRRRLTAWVGLPWKNTNIDSPARAVCQECAAAIAAVWEHG